MSPIVLDNGSRAIHNSAVYIWRHPLYAKHSLRRRSHRTS